MNGDGPRTEPAAARDLPFPAELFTVAGHPAFLMAAGALVAGQPWVWYAPTFLPGYPRHDEAWMFERFRAAGMAVAGVDAGESYGSPAGTAVYSALYAELSGRRGLSARPSLLARSRGGLMLYNWAVEHPQCVASIAGIYPVCDLASYPGLDKASAAYGMAREALAAALAAHNPVERLRPLAEARVPILHIHGDCDDLVPLAANSQRVAQRYAALGGTMTLDVVHGGGHDLSPHWFQNQALVDFVTGHREYPCNM